MLPYDLDTVGVGLICLGFDASGDVQYAQESIGWVKTEHTAD
ncbi:hypothetical protein [Deinococcus sp.]|nr:hypothetical protein [Deinococcus sp.]